MVLDLMELYLIIITFECQALDYGVVTFLC